MEQVLMFEYYKFSQNIFILTQCSFKLSLERDTDLTFLSCLSIHLFTIYFICLNVCLHIIHMHIRPLRLCGKQL